MASNDERLRVAKIGMAFLGVVRLHNLWHRVRQERRKNRRWYMNPANVSRSINIDLDRFHDTGDRDHYFRLDQHRFGDLLKLLGPSLYHPPTHALPITSELRLALTLRVLASGESVKSVANSYGIAYQTAMSIVYETCDAMWDILRPQVLETPEDSDWFGVAREFWEKYRFPHCLGAIDGRQIVIKKPQNASIDRWMVILAVVDSNYRFLRVDIGQYRSDDGGVFKDSSLGRAISENNLNLPGSQVLPDTDAVCPYVFVASDACPIGLHLLKPYAGMRPNNAQLDFDNRLSWVNSMAENAFGVLASRWRMLQNPIGSTPENVIRIIKALMVLHNYLISNDAAVDQERRYMPAEMLDHYDDDTGQFQGGEWRNTPQDIAFKRLESCKNKCKVGNEIRQRFTDYFQMHTDHAG